MPTLRYQLQDQPRVVTLSDRTRIGREDDNDLCIADNSLSRHHAVLSRDGEGFRLTDQGSRNGILVNNERTESLLLQDGMRFRLGDVEFVFQADGAGAEPHGEPEEIRAPPSALRPPDGVGAPLHEARETILAEIGKVIVGQKEVLNQVLVALFARGHCLLIGVPGLAKTLLVRTLAQAVALEGNRIQFTPDLMPSDITGTDILEEDPVTGKRQFRFHRGPIFTHLLLADEINRTPPKTQAALLEAMQERRVTAAGQTYDLPDPFMVLATQNPIEQEGTYPLPEAQLDRFMFCVLLKYPSFEDEQRVLLETTRDATASIGKVLDGPSILRCQHLVRQVPVSEHVALYAMNLIRATRPDTEGAPDFIKRWVRWGAGTRAGQYLLLAAKAHVLLQGRVSVSCADVRAYAPPVLRHRLFCNFAAASEGVSTDDIVKKVLESVKEPEYLK